MQRNTKTTIILAITAIALIVFLAISAKGLIDARGQKDDIENQIKIEQSQIEDIQSQNQNLEQQIESMQPTIDAYNSASK